MSEYVYDQEIYEIVLEVLAKHDLEELISIGCPSDEYSPEAKPIAAYLSSHDNVSEEILVEGIAEVWAYYFMFDVPREKYVAVAKDIRERLYK